MTMGVTLSGPLIAVSKETWQEVGSMMPDSLASGIVYGHWTRLARESLGTRLDNMQFLTVRCFVFKVC